MAALSSCAPTPRPAPSEEPRAQIAEKDLTPDARPEPSVEASPKSGWADFNPEKETEGEESSGIRKAFLWIPNRLLDLIDVFKVDVGVGPAAGGVVRITKWGQAGIRTMAPAMLRVGDMGRTWPVKIEHSNELGISPAFLQSNERTVCPGEVGLGLDLFLIGGYAGVCFDELYDFVAGIFLEDVKKDDLQ